MATIPTRSPTDRTKPASILPADLMEMQLSTIDLLAAMYAAPEELEIPATTAECLEKLRTWCQEDPSREPPSGIPSSVSLCVSLPLADTDKRLPVHLSIPLHQPSSSTAEASAPDQTLPPPSYSLRPDWMSKAEVAKLAATMPANADADVFETLIHLQDAALHFLEAQQLQQEEQQSNAEITDPLVRVWFYFPSLSTREKRDDMVNHAPDFGLTGFVLAGKPGVLCLEGGSAQIDAYMKFIKTHSWGDIPSHQKKVSERFRETGSQVRRVFAGMEEITDSLGERGGQRANRGDMQALEQWLRERGLGEAFERVIF
ncbi:DUF1115 domain protein [Aspergillus homomorphus CBS 101889]|uniref:Small nuclear ribonucleoprotein Prp3 C-terminal domain-containing protein n=1 Tax=Aspergillus homomorphus (strain CBS 101889) TaxID=1450537 RepID=A0A395HHH9_ASPHC|nr:hypothetical protein BO97DRAFT_356681 [Aspergillus homomorphus CBS 101889]RAL07372.1 hypothetical protein BO97DRAFT_356681 [Aspergillus homomorphus CBS 101889]